MHRTGIDHAVPYTAVVMTRENGTQAKAYPLQEGYLQACGRTREEMDAELRPQAEDTIKARMALNEVCRLEGITVTQEEVDAAYAEVAAMYGVSVQEVKDAYGQDNDEKLRKDVLLKKAIAVLEANAEITEE